MAKLASFFFFPESLGLCPQPVGRDNFFRAWVGLAQTFLHTLGHMDLTRPKHVQHPFISLLVIMVIINKQIGIVISFNLLIRRILGMIQAFLIYQGFSRVPCRIHFFFFFNFLLSTLISTLSYLSLSNLFCFYNIGGLDGLEPGLALGKIH